MKLHALILTVFLLTGCNSLPVVTVTPAQPPAAAALSTKQDEQIAALVSTVANLRRQLDTVAGANTAIKLVGLPNTPVSPGKPVIERESGVISKAAGEPSADELAKSLARANAELQKKVELADKLYGEKLSEVDILNKTITTQAKLIADTDRLLAELRDKADEERTTLAADFQKQFDAKQKEIDTVKSEAASKERKYWVNTVRITGIGLLVVGVAILAISKGLMMTQGFIFLLGGAFVIAIGMTYDIVASQVWFPYVACILGLGILGGGGWTCWHLYQQGKLNSTAVAVFNDIKTEADTLGDKGAEAWAKIEPHIEYRFGQVGSAARDQLRKLQVKLGLDSK